MNKIQPYRKICIISDAKFPLIFFQSLEENLFQILRSHLQFKYPIQLIGIYETTIVFSPHMRDEKKLHTFKRFFIPDGFSKTFSIRWFDDLHKNEYSQFPQYFLDRYQKRINHTTKMDLDDEK